MTPFTLFLYMVAVAAGLVVIGLCVIGLWLLYLYIVGTLRTKP
jgi:hypothetical protein